MLLSYIIKENYPPERWTLFPLCVFLPALVVLVSWLLIYRSRRYALAAVLLGGVAAWLIISSLQEQLRRFEVYRQAHPNAVAEATIEELASPWVAAFFPFVMMALFYLTTKRRTREAPAP